MTEERVAELEKLGFKRWQKGNLDRLYVNASQLGLICSYYGTGNIRSAEFDGVGISNSEARRMKASKTFVDVKTDRVYSDNKTLKEKAMEIVGVKGE